MLNNAIKSREDLWLPCYFEYHYLNSQGEIYAEGNTRRVTRPTSIKTKGLERHHRSKSNVIPEPIARYNKTEQTE